MDDRKQDEGAGPDIDVLEPEATEAPELDAARLERIHAAIEAREAATVAAELEPLHAADIADLLEQISGPQRRALLSLYALEIDGEILSDWTNRSARR